MAEPNTTIASSGAALVTLATVAVGQLLGEYSIIIFSGLLGTLIALTEQSLPSFKASALFVFKGVVFSFMFTGIITSIAIDYVPDKAGLTPYALLGAVSFCIGWTSNKWEKMKDWFINFITSFKKG